MKLRSILLTAVLSLGLALPAFTAETFRVPTGLLYNEPEKTYNGYTLVSAMMSPNTYLIDMKGDLVHQWTGTMQVMYAEILPNGNLLRHVRFPDSEQQVPMFGGACGKLEEVDWDGKIIWEYTMFGDGITSHHAFDRLPNGNTMFLGWERKSYADLKAKGRKDGVGRVTDKPIEYPTANGGKIAVDGIWPDFIREVNPKGETVWEYHVWDNIGTGPDQFDVNFIGVPGHDVYSGPDWTHWNAVRYNPKTNQVLVDSRNWGEVYIIDYATKKMIYRWGNPGAYGQGKLPSYYNDGDQKLFGLHDVNWLENGNISAFDNGTNRPTGAYSRVVEINPKENKIVWQFSSFMPVMMPNSFYSSYQSAAQKLPNGNWFVTSTMSGHLFEITPDKKIVWEYVNPMAGNGLWCSTDQSLGFMVHRAFRYGPDYAGLKGKDLKSKGPLVEGCPDWVASFQVKPWKGQFPAGQ